MKKVFFLIAGLLLSFSLIAQVKIEVKGQVKDGDSNETLPSASVAIKGTAVGVLTDANGNFKLSVDKPSEATLRVSYVGYKTVELKVGNQREFVVALEKDGVQLLEVVAIGYATVDKRDVTGSISSVNAKQLEDIPVSSVAQALAGRLGGVQITASEGSPDAEVLIKVRGGNSITQDNSPIYIIDGVQMEDGLSSLAIQDIESIDVLKDAASSSIYGARGANGVVIITTKQGLRGKTKINYNPFFSINKVARKMDVMSVYNYLDYQLDRKASSTIDTTAFFALYGKDLSVYKDVEGVDWQQLMFGRDAFGQTHNISASGGGKDSRFNLGYTKYDQDAIMLKSNLNRDVVNFKFENNVSARLKVGANLRYTNEITTGAGVSSGASAQYNLLRHVIRYQPLLGNGVLVDELDELYDTGSTNFSLSNPLALNNGRDLTNQTQGVLLSGNLEYKLKYGFTFRSVLGYNFNVGKRQAFDSEISPVGRTTGGGLAMVGDISSERKTLNNSNTLSYDKKFSQNHTLNLLVGQEINELNYEALESRFRDFPRGTSAEKALGQYNLGVMYAGYPLSTNYESRLLSFFSRANYSFKNKYVLTASLRTDGSSKFKEGQRWGYFPAVSAAWKISQEQFMSDVRFVNDLKLRLSLGRAGNNRIADYLYISNFATNGNYYLNHQLQQGYYVENLVNERLKWETTTSRNLGLDFRIFKGLNVSVDAYTNTTNDLLIDIPIPVSSGYVSQLQNVAKTSAKGIEIILSGAPVKNKNFTWTTNFNIAFNRNKILKLSDYVTERKFSSNTLNATEDFILRKNSPLGLMYGFVSDGYHTVDDFDVTLDNTNTERPYLYTLKPTVANASGILTNIQVGTMKFKDLNNDGVINDLDKTVIGNANPKFTGGFNQQFRYKNFDFSVFVNFVYGNSVYNASKLEFTSGYSNNTNMLAMMNDAYKTGNGSGVKLVGNNTTSASVIKFLGPDPEVLNEINKNANIWTPVQGVIGFPNSWAIEDGSFLRLNNISFGYTLPNSVLKKAKVIALRFYGTLNNLAIWTNYTGYDPEVNTRRSTPLTPSVDYSAYPRSKSFVFGLNLTL